MSENMILTKYDVLMPMKANGMYKFVGAVFYETEIYKTKTADFIKKLLVESGEYDARIRVIKG